MTRRQEIGFAAFCLIAASRWLADNAFPATLPLFEQESLRYLLVGLIGLAFLTVRKRTLYTPTVPWLQLTMASLLLLGLPTVLGEAANGVTAATRVGLFALAPLLIVVGASSIGEDFAHGRVLMMPALIGLSGMLLLVPFQFPSSLLGDLSFALGFAAVLLTVIGSLWIYRLIHQCGMAAALVILCGANALLMALAARLTHQLIVPLASDLRVELLRGAILDLPLLSLLVWLLQDVSPSKLASRFLLIPLLSALEGAILLHAAIGLRMACGMILIAIGSVALLFLGTADALENKQLLGLK